MANPRVGITLGVDGAEASARTLETVAQRGAAAFQRLRGSMDTVGTGANFAEGKLKSLNRGIGDAAGAAQLLSTVIPGMNVNFAGLAGTIGNVADVFGTLSGLLLRNPIGLAATAITAAAGAFLYLRSSTEQATTALADYEKAISASNGVLQTANELSREAAQAKIDEAKARVQATLAAEQEAQAGLIRSRLLIDQQRAAIVDANKGLPGFDPSTVLRDPLAKLSREFAEVDQRIAELQDRLGKLNDPAQLGGARQSRENRAAQFFDQTRTAAEKYAASLKELNELRERGDITPEVYGRAVRQAQDALDAAQKIGSSSGRAAIDNLPDQFARLAAALDPVVARERELIDSTRILDEAQARLGVSTETITDLKARLADKAYAATEAGKADAAAVAEAQRLYDASITPMEAYTKQLEAIARALELNKIGEEQASRAREAASKQLEQANEESKASKKTARDLGLAFSSAFEDAVVGGKKLRDVIDGLGQDLLRVFIRRQLTEPLLELFSTATKGIGGSGGLFDGILGGIGKSLGAAIGGIFGGGGSQLPVGNISGIYARGGAFAGGAEIVPFARGGALVSRPTMFPMRGGRVGLMGEAGPEAIMPLARDSSGRLGVRGGGSGAPVIQITNHVDARGADKMLRDQLPGMLRQSSEQTIDQVAQLMDRGGTFSRKSGRRTF